MMYLLFSAVVGQLTERRIAGNEAHWFMYDSFPGATPGMRAFKTVVGSARTASAGAGAAPDRSGHLVTAAAPSARHQATVVRIATSSGVSAVNPSASRASVTSATECGMSPGRPGPPTGTASVPTAAATSATRSNNLVRRPVATLHVMPLGASDEPPRRPARTTSSTGIGPS